VNSIALLTGDSRALVKVGRYVTSAAFDVVGARQRPRRIRRSGSGSSRSTRLVGALGPTRSGSTNSPPRDSRADPDVAADSYRRAIGLESYAATQAFLLGRLGAWKQELKQLINDGPSSLRSAQSLF